MSLGTPLLTCPASGHGAVAELSRTYAPRGAQAVLSAPTRRTTIRSVSRRVRLSFPSVGPTSVIPVADRRRGGRGVRCRSLLHLEQLPYYIAVAPGTGFGRPDPRASLLGPPRPPHLAALLPLLGCLPVARAPTRMVRTRAPDLLNNLSATPLLAPLAH